MKVTLTIGGRARTFTEVENISIEEEEIITKKTEMPEETVSGRYKIANTPTEGKAFKVIPEFIDENLFNKPREDSRQEKARQRIMKAIEKARTDSRYSKPFKTMVPVKDWKERKIKEIRRSVKDEGNHIANWVEQGLEWAQRIMNGESWENMCNKPDTLEYYRLVVWTDDNIHMVGGSTKGGRTFSATSVFYNVLIGDDKICDAVPSIVLKD